MYKVVVGKHVVYCETTQEVAQLLEEFKRAAQLDARGSAWIDLLRVLKDLSLRRSQGLTSSDIGRLSGLRAGRGLGPRLRVWRKLLAEQGLDIEDVVIRYRMDGSRRWRAGPKIVEAIAVAERLA